MSWYVTQPPLNSQGLVSLLLPMTSCWPIKRQAVKRERCHRLPAIFKRCNQLPTKIMVSPEKFFTEACSPPARDCVLAFGNSSCVNISRLSYVGTTSLDTVVSIGDQPVILWRTRSRRFLSIIFPCAHNLRLFTSRQFGIFPFFLVRSSLEPYSDSQLFIVLVQCVLMNFFWVK